MQRWLAQTSAHYPRGRRPLHRRAASNDGAVVPKTKIEGKDETTIPIIFCVSDRSFVAARRIIRTKPSAFGASIIRGF
jgi:hypothetical protein